MLFSEVALSVSICLLMAFTMFVGSVNLEDKVTMERYYYESHWDNGSLLEVSIIGENSSFPGEEKRRLYQTMLYLMPTGNALMMSNKISRDIPNNTANIMEHRLDYNNTIILLSSISEILILTVIGMSVLYNN